MTEMHGHRTDRIRMHALLRFNARSVVINAVSGITSEMKTVCTGPALSLRPFRAISRGTVGVIVTGRLAATAPPLGDDARAGNRIIAEASLFRTIVIAVTARRARKVLHTSLPAGATLWIWVGTCIPVNARRGIVAGAR